MTQALLFSMDPSDYVTVDEASAKLGVSKSTIRNWMKTGYLQSSQNHLIRRESLEAFCSNVAGVDKLNKRANKSLFDSHDHSLVQQNFSDRICSAVLVDTESLSDEYESSLSNSYRNKEGIYYTPFEVADDFFNFLPSDLSQMTFCDPCCGTGNFLVAALNRGLLPHNIYGFDTDPIGIEIAKRRIFELSGYATTNLIHGDFLEMDARHSFAPDGFDIIFTNPPWGKKLSKSDKLRLSLKFNVGQSGDSCSMFVGASISALRTGGYLGLLLPEAFFNVATFQDVRRKLLEYRLLALSDYGKPFTTLISKAKGVVLRVESPSVDSTVLCRSRNKHHNRAQATFDRNPKCILNFSCEPEDLDLIDHLYRIPHMTLSGNARWGLGIVTGNNERFLSGKKLPGYIAVYKGSDIQRGGIREASNFIPEDLSLYQQVAPREMYLSKEKLIYKFISSDLVFYHDQEQRFLLNSANMIILRDGFPISASLLSQYLNCSLLTWIFKSIFQTHKVLRSDLEQLPIYSDFLGGVRSFTECALLDYLGLEKKESDGSFRIKS